MLLFREKTILAASATGQSDANQDPTAKSLFA
jgi:hypothetical protein